MSDQSESSDLQGLTTRVVASHVANNSVAVADLPKLIQQVYDALAGRGYIIYPGKLTVAPSFRIGCIGHLDDTVINGALDAIKATLKDLGVASGAP